MTDMRRHGQDLSPIGTTADAYRAYLDSLPSPESRRTMAGCLDRVARLMSGDEAATGAGQPWHLLRYRHTSRLPALLREAGMAPSYINKHLVAVRRVLKEAWKLRLMSGEDYQQAASVESLAGQRLPRGRHIDGTVIAGALAACDADDSPAGARDAAIIAVLHSTGCRRAEICGIGVDDLDLGERAIAVHGKGNKQRLVHLTVGAAERVGAWLAVRGRGEGALFNPIAKSGRLRRRDGALSAMSGQAIADMLARRVGGGFTPHDFRRTFIGELLDAGVDVATTQQLVGHASPDTTVRYDRRPARRRRDAVDRLRLPGRD
ncbi:MAG TPA: tyrosine-type recombinase/integrase [Stackebrandtia sp.]|jgi:integrase|uniref:tyrosine-type recombinase/integrase n=1 Tax=Stackebrandtia sp. TaxID=2023065 RepID=UPI002D3C2C95|nr:tyrosine-type recombinase/integrase [Stackebrandtia sp.]HZE38911.1 tyrosine-type recombinase/integrase [Stackebrandtia sp.]